MWIKQSYVYDKVLGTKFCMFVTRHGTVTNVSVFGGLQKVISRKKYHVVPRLTT